MAVIKLRSTSSANRLINYCERKAEERDGLNCDPEYVREQMQMTREEWNKTDGIQAHHVIQSFNPEDNITAREANELGRRLAQEIAPGHEVAVYTHTDRNHIHNHLVINSVSFENGHKYHSDREQLYRIREKSDELCLEKGLNIIKEHTQAERLTMAERQIAERGGRLWKDELRTAIDEAKQKTQSIDQMKSYLKETYDIEMKVQDKNVSFLHPEKQKYCRGKTLGEAYTKESLAKDLDRNQTQEQNKQAVGILNRELPSHQPEQYKPTQQIDGNQRYQKGLDALRSLTQTGQQQGMPQQQNRTKSRSQKYQNKRTQSRVQQQKQGSNLER